MPVLLTKPGRGVIQFGASSFWKVSQRGKYSYLEKSPKWICPFYNYLPSALCTAGVFYGTMLGGARSSVSIFRRKLRQAARGHTARKYRAGI